MLFCEILLGHQIVWFYTVHQVCEKNLCDVKSKKKNKEFDLDCSIPQRETKAESCILIFFPGLEQDLISGVSTTKGNPALYGRQQSQPAPGHTEPQRLSSHDV